LSVGFDNLQDSFDDRVHGAIWFSRCEIWIDEELNPSVNSVLLHRFFFTLAHELGHWFLHRHLFVDEDGNPTLFVRDSQRDVIGRSFSRRPLIERQADEFAGCLLMPEWLLRPAWRLFTGGDGSVTDDAVRGRVGNIDPARSSFVDEESRGSSTAIAVIRAERSTHDQPIHLEEALCRERMIRFYTINNAWLMRADDEIGSLEVGKRADFCGLEGDFVDLP